MKIFAFVFLLLLVSCNKPDQHPELKDEIYKDLSARVATLEADILTFDEKLKKQDEEVKNEDREFFKKRQHSKYIEMQKARSKAEQELKYLKIRVETRRIFVKRAYFEARKAGKTLDTAKEYELYKKIADQRAIISHKSEMPEAPAAAEGKGEGGGEEAPPEEE